MRKSIVLIGCIFLLASCSTNAEALTLRASKSGSSSSAAVSSTGKLKTFKPRPKDAAPIDTPVPLTNYKIPILVYHHIRKQEGWSKATWSWKMTVSPSVFETQMKWLSDHGYTSMNLNDIMRMIRGEIPKVDKPVVLTFDDNNLNSYENGVPIMKKYGITAVFYIVSNRLKHHDTIDEDRIRQLVADGFSIESHTVSHSTLTNLSIAKLDQELTESKRVLEELTGKPVLHVAYPSTAQNATVREHAKLAGYETATIMDPRYMTEKDDLYKLPRIMMTDDTNLAKVLP